MNNFIVGFLKLYSAENFFLLSSKIYICVLFKGGYYKK